MALDGLVIHGIVHELQRCVGQRIIKIYQPAQHDIVWHMRIERQNLRLLLSAHPAYPRVHFTQSERANPLQAPMFCMVLRKHCENGIIQSIRQVDMERIIHIDIMHRNEMGDAGLRRMVIELMGRHSNIILLDPATGRIFDSIQHVTPALSSHRVVLPGQLYVDPPEQNKAHPLELTATEIDQLLASSELPLAKSIVQHISGISPLVGKEFAHRVETSSQSAGRVIAEACDAIRAHQYTPHIVDNHERSAFSVVPLTHLSGTTTTFETISECLETFYGNKAERDAIKQQTSDLRRLIQNEHQKNERKMQKLHDTLQRAEQADQYRIAGELLTAHLHEVEKGKDSIEVTNYYDEDGGTLTIALDPQLTPAENAQQYFTKYRKGKNSLAIMHQQIKQTEMEMAYLASLLQQLDHATRDDIEDIRQELIAQQYLRARNRHKQKKQQKKRPTLYCYTSSEGVPIYVGRNNTQNDYLTMRFARASDTWLHTKDIPGSHVVIRSTDFGDTTLEEAAMIAAYHSQARDSSQVPVDYTLIKHVRKPNGAKPGYVIYEQQKTRYITPDEARIKQLKMDIQ